MDDLNSLSTLGLVLPSPAYLFGLIFFGIAGYAGYRYGKKAGLAKPKWIGIVMMLYPYAISTTEWLYAIGIGLCALFYIYRK